MGATLRLSAWGFISLLVATTLLSAPRKLVAPFVVGKGNEGCIDSSSVTALKSQQSLGLRDHSDHARGFQPGPTCLSTGVNASVPVVLLSLGRSGSGSTWQVMGALSGGATRPDEYSGKNWNASQIFFEEHTTGDWLLEILCEKQRRHSGGITGIKWKPFNVPIMQSKGSIAALQLIREHPEIKLVRSRRNILDVIISKHKHKQHEYLPHAPKVKGHCRAGDALCQAKHLNASSGMVLPTENLTMYLEHISSHEDAVDRMLQEMGIPHIQVSYERLYHSDTADEWMRILRFLHREPTKNLTIADVQAVMELAPTSHAWHNITLGNYEEVRSLLAGTEFEKLLH